jgi:hypothetical protein
VVELLETRCLLSSSGLLPALLPPVTAPASQAVAPLAAASTVTSAVTNTLTPPARSAAGAAANPVSTPATTHPLSAVPLQIDLAVSTPDLGGDALQLSVNAAAQVGGSSLVSVQANTAVHADVGAALDLGATTQVGVDLGSTPGATGGSGSGVSVQVGTGLGVDVGGGGGVGVGAQLGGGSSSSGTTSDNQGGGGVGVTVSVGLGDGGGSRAGQSGGGLGVGVNLGGTTAEHATSLPPVGPQTTDPTSITPVPVVSGPVMGPVPAPAVDPAADVIARPLTDSPAPAQVIGDAPAPAVVTLAPSAGLLPQAPPLFGPAAPDDGTAQGPAAGRLTGDDLLAADILPVAAADAGEVTPSHLHVLQLSATAAQDVPPPQAAALVTEANPFELSALENVVQQFLAQLTGLQQELHGWLAALGFWPWVLIALAVTAAASELLRRRQAQSRWLIAASAGDLALSCLPGPDDRAADGKRA